MGNKHSGDRYIGDENDFIFGDFENHCCSTYDFQNEVQVKELDKILKSEIKSNYMFQKAWDKAKKLNKNSTKLSENELLSVVMYTLDKPPIYQEFNAQTREFQKALGDERFQYKGMHFFLHSAINKLQDEGGPYHVYRGVTHEVTADVGDGFHFDSFASTSTNLEIAKQFGTQNRPNNTWEEITLFEIPNTYKGVKIGHFSMFAEEEVVIPPCEKFKVVEIKTEKKKWLINNLKKKVMTTQICLETE